MLEATTPLSLPPFKGSTFRGAFGSALKRVVCQTNQRDCGACFYQRQCLYPYAFEPRAAQDSDGHHGRDLPRPFVLVPPLTARREYQPGERIRCELVLIGRAIDFLPQFVRAVDEMGRHGLGRARGRCRLAEVSSFDGDGKARLIYSSDEGVLRDPGPPIMGSHVIAPYVGASPREVTVEFLTPTRLKFNQHLHDCPDFSVFIRRLGDRITALLKRHHGMDVDLNGRDLTQSAESVTIRASNTSWYDWERYSNRQKTRMKLGGILGTVTYTGDVGPFLPLLALGERVHVGKGATFGLGRYSVRGMEP